MMLKNLKTKMYLNEFGFAVFNYDDIIKKYEQFADKWRDNGEPELYFVTMDIEKCYDNVNTDELTKFLNQTDLLDKEYFVLNCLVLKRKHNVFMESKTFKKQPMRAHFRHKFVRLGIDGGDYPSLH